ncbi:MAG: DNA polymerase IV [Candidatus Eiseniibacteriota bacterium]
MILLVDMDAFFASVEQAHHPVLRGQPVIVCGDPSRRGVVTAASYEARPRGVHAGMPLQEARRLCPEAHYVEGNPEKYVAISLALLRLYLSITPDVEPFSVDEAFLAVGGSRGTMDQAVAIASDLQGTIETRFGLTASIGIGPNKLIAKMAAGLAKPRGLTPLDEESFRRAFWPTEARTLWGVGPKLSERLRMLGIVTVGDLAHAPAETLEAAFGIIGPQLREAAWGRDETRLVPYHEGVEAKSMGHEVTLPEDCDDPAFLEGTLLRLSDQVGRRLRSDGYLGRTVAVKLRDRNFTTRIRQRVLPDFTADHRTIFDTARTLWRENWHGEALRLLGVTVSSLERARPGDQTELFLPERRAERLREAMDRVRDKLGESSLVPAGALTHRRRLGHVPFGPVTGSRKRDRA